MEIVEVLELHRRQRAIDPDFGSTAASGPVFALPAEEPAQAEEGSERPSALAPDLVTLIDQQLALG